MTLFEALIHFAKRQNVSRNTAHRVGYKASCYLYNNSHNEDNCVTSNSLITTWRMLLLVERHHTFFKFHLSCHLICKRGKQYR